MTAAEVYTHLGRSLLNVTPYSGWAKILLRIERTQGAQGYTGIVLAEAEQVFQGLLTNSLTEENIFEPIEELYRITTQGGNNNWNLLYFTLMPGGAFEVDFVWDEDQAATLAAIASTRNMREPEREKILTQLDEEITAAKTARLYRSISQRLPSLAVVVAPSWQKITLRIARWNEATFTLRGFVEASNLAEAEEFNVTQDWSLIKEFYELSTMVLHPRWNQAEWVILPDGTYSIVFDWDAERNPRIPPRVTFPFTREGHWQELG